MSFELHFEFEQEAGYGNDVRASFESRLTQAIVQKGLSPTRVDRRRLGSSDQNEERLRVVFVIQAENEWAARQEAAKISDVLDSLGPTGMHLRTYEVKSVG